MHNFSTYLSSSITILCYNIVFFQYIADLYMVTESSLLSLYGELIEVPSFVKDQVYTNQMKRSKSQHYFVKLEPSSLISGAVCGSVSHGQLLSNSRPSKFNLDFDFPDNVYYSSNFRFSYFWDQLCKMSVEFKWLFLSRERKAVFPPFPLPVRASLGQGTQS